MNLSTTAACPSDTAAAVQYAINHHVVVVNSAGNFGGGATQPANCPGIISVAATQRDKTLAAYTSRGNVTLAAPGGSGTLANHGGYGAGVDCAHSDTTFGTDDGVLSSWAVSPVVIPSADDYCYRYLSGTSMAAPHVSGTIGLMLSARPEGVTFTPAQITRLLVLTAQPLACAGTTCGAGLLDARAAVTAASRGGVPRLEVTPPSFAFDPLRVGASSAILTVVATSTGVGPVTIPSFELTGTGAAQFQIDFPGCGQRCTGPFTIPQDTQIGFRVACRPTAAGTWFANLVFHNNSDTGDVAIQLSCMATAPELVLDTASIDFLVSHLGTPAPTRPVHITNAGTAMLTFQTRLAAPFFTTCTSGCTCTGSICSGTVPPSGTAALAVGYTPSALGLQSGTLTLTSDDPFHPAVPLQLRGTGGIGTGSLAPLAFGDVQLGSAAVGSLTLTNTGSYPLTVTAIDLTDAADFELAYASGPCAGATHCAVAQQAATTLAIPVRCHPAARGAVTSQITLATDGAPAQVTAQELAVSASSPHPRGDGHEIARALEREDVHRSSANCFS
jgi:subtilisin family serine protease